MRPAAQIYAKAPKYAKGKVAFASKYNLISFDPELPAVIRNWTSEGESSIPMLGSNHGEYIHHAACLDQTMANIWISIILLLP